MELLKKAHDWLGRRVVGDGTAGIDSVRGLQQTIRFVLTLWDLCKEAGMTYLCTRRLNQDPLEKLFGVIRQKGETWTTLTQRSFAMHISTQP